MVREFKLINDKGQEYSLMDIEGHCLMTEPTGLGYSYSTEYEQLGNTFVTNLRKIEQGKVTGQVNFLKYDNFKSLVDFIEYSDKLRLAYTIPYKSGAKTYYKDIQIQELTKSEIQPNGVMSETITFDALSLWYAENVFTYDMARQPQELRWNFRWDARFGDYSQRMVGFINDGHAPAPVEIKINGEVINPKISLKVNGETYQEVTFATTIEENETLLYGTKENDFYIYREAVDGTLTSLFDLDIINFANDNVIRLPKQKDCTLVLTSDNGVTNAQVKIYVYYKAI